MTIFAMDLGNKQTKLYSEKTDKKGKVLPSHFIYSSDLGNDQTSIFKNTLNIHTYKTSFDDEQYSWGADMHRLHIEDKFLDTISFENRYNTEDFKLLANFALAELASDFGKEAVNSILEVTVITGVPSDDFNETDVKHIMNVLDGDHTITRDGVNYIVRVKDVNVLPQAVGTVYNEILDDTGFVKSDKESLLEEEIVVNDIGGGTHLIDVLKNMNLSASYQSTSGIFVLYDMVVNSVKNNHPQGNSITVYEVEQILRQGNSDDGYVYKPSKNVSIDITKEVKSATRKYSREVINRINTSLKQSSSIDTMLFTGGGANLIDQKSVIDRYQHSIFVDQSETANVQGFYKYGVALSLETEAAATEE